jgi:hypothetical protein
MSDITLGARGNDGKLSMAFISTVNKAYTKLSIQLHQAACVAFYRAAQFGDPDSLNAFHNNLRVNDQTALRVWVGQHSTYMDLEANEMRSWMKWNKEKGFHLVKGKEEFRKDLYTIDSEEEGKDMLLMFKPFYDKNVKDKDAITLEVLITMLQKAAKSVSDKSKKEDVKLPADILNLVTSINNTTTKELEALNRIKE